jgi:hypothetical protein
VRKGSSAVGHLSRTSHLKDLMTTKEAPESLKIKLPNGTVFNMSIFSQGNTEEYPAHVVAVLRLINQKGFNVQCRKLVKAVDKLARNLENLQKGSGSAGLSSKDKKDAHKLELIMTQEMLQGAQKAHIEAAAKMYKLLRNLLFGDVQFQWDCVCVCVILTSSRGGLSSDAVPTARQINPPPTPAVSYPPFRHPISLSLGRC